MNHGSQGENAYKSKYWPSLNGVADETAFFSSAWEWGKLKAQTEREVVLLDVIGAYDLLLLHGLTPEGASVRLGLRRSRDELVQELDLETARRLLEQPPPPSPKSPEAGEFLG